MDVAEYCWYFYLLYTLPVHNSSKEKKRQKIKGKKYTPNPRSSLIIASNTRTLQQQNMWMNRRLIIQSYLITKIKATEKLN